MRLDSDPLLAGVRKSELPLVVAPPLRIAVKYDMESLRKRLVSVVADEWPLTLEAWDLWQENILKTWPRPGSRNTTFCTFNEWAPEPASAIMFARAFGCAEILPAAFYLLSTIKDPKPWDTPGMEEVRTHRARWHLLDATAWQTLYRGRVALDEYCVHRARHIPALWKSRQRHAPRCEKPADNSCWNAWEMVLTSVFESEWWSSATLDPLNEMLKRAGEKGVSIVKELCEPCRNALRGQIVREREALWRELPSKFGLDGSQD